MARFSSGASVRQCKRSRNASETASLSSWGSEVNVLSDAEVAEVPKKRRSTDSAASLDQDDPTKNYSSSEDESQQFNSNGSTRGKRPKCFSRNAVLARQNRLKKKKYIEDLENELQALRKENSKLKVSLEGYSKDAQLVRKENIYLRNVLANSKEISQLLRSINVNCGLPVTSSLKRSAEPKTSLPVERSTNVGPKVGESLAINVPDSNRDSCVPSENPVCNSSVSARTTRKDFPIAVDDVSLSLSAPEDEDDLGILFGSKNVAHDLDLNLNESPCDDADYLGFGPNAFGDWLDGEEPLSHIGVCLHVANQKVSVELCPMCNENAFNSWNSMTV